MCEGTSHFHVRKRYNDSLLFSIVGLYYSVNVCWSCRSDYTPTFEKLYLPSFKSWVFGQFRNLHYTNYCIELRMRLIWTDLLVANSFHSFSFFFLQLLSIHLQKIVQRSIGVQDQKAGVQACSYKSFLIRQETLLVL